MPSSSAIRVVFRRGFDEGAEQFRTRSVLAYAEELWMPLNRDHRPVGIFVFDRFDRAVGCCTNDAEAFAELFDRLVMK